jgi:uncharacterized membrane protein YbhN (UPF0104 family)
MLKARMRDLAHRWGVRSIALLVTAIGVYVVAPSLVSLFDAWPSLGDVRPAWFVFLTLLEAASLACLWWLTRLSLRPRGSPAPQPHVGWGDVIAAQLAGNAASRVLPGGGATGGVVQANLLVRSGEPVGSAASALGAIGLLTTGVLLCLPVLTVPALLIGPPPARQLQLGLLVSCIAAVVIVVIGLVMLHSTRVVNRIGSGVGRVLHLFRRSVSRGPRQPASWRSGTGWPRRSPGTGGGHWVRPR